MASKKSIQTSPDRDGKAYVGSRIPKDVKAKLDRKALRERRSLSAVIELLLIQATSTES